MELLLAAEAPELEKLGLYLRAARLERKLSDRRHWQRPVSLSWPRGALCRKPRSLTSRRAIANRRSRNCFGKRGRSTFPSKS